MRKKLFMYAAFCSMVVTATLFASCGGDDDAIGGEDAGSKTATEAKVIYEAKFSEDILKYCDVKIAYLDAEGTARAEYATANWSKTVVCKKFAAKVGLMYVITIKKGIDIDKEPLSIGSGCAISYNAYNSKGETVGSRSEPCNVSDRKTSKELFIKGFSGEGHSYKSYIEIYEDGSCQNQ